VFALSSVITPFFLGAVVGGIASGRVPADGYGDRWTSWVNPTSLLAGVIAVGTCAFLAGVFLCADADASWHRGLTARLRARTLILGAVTGAVVFAGLLPLHDDAPTLWQGLTHQALPLILIAAVAGLATMLVLWRRRYGVARLTAVVAVASVVSGWGIGKYPWLLVDEVTIADAGGADATLTALLVVVALAGVTVLPALGLLFRLTQSHGWRRD